MMDFVVVGADENQTIVAKKLSSQEDPWIHHREPSRVIAAARLWITREQIPFGVDLAC